MYKVIQSRTILYKIIYKEMYNIAWYEVQKSISYKNKDSLNVPLPEELRISLSGKF